MAGGYPYHGLFRTALARIQKRLPIAGVTPWTPTQPDLRPHLQIAASAETAKNPRTNPTYRFSSQ